VAVRSLLKSLRGQEIPGNKWSAPWGLGVPKHPRLGKAPGMANGSTPSINNAEMLIRAPDIFPRHPGMEPAPGKRETQRLPPCPVAA